jgi:Type II secretion system (T2SS), protein E, N-terminal domain
MTLPATYKELLDRFLMRVHDSRLIAADDLARLDVHSNASPERRLESICVLGLFDNELGRLFQDTTGFEFIDTRKYEIQDDVLDLVSESLLFDREFLPFAYQDGSISIAMGDPTNTGLIANLAFVTGARIQAFATCRQFVNDRVDKYFVVYDRIYETCPECNSAEVLRIVYGLPSSEALDGAGEGRFLLGGCSYGRDCPLWHCKVCQHRWR